MKVKAVALRLLAALMFPVLVSCVNPAPERAADTPSVDVGQASQPLGKRRCVPSVAWSPAHFELSLAPGATHHESVALQFTRRRGPTRIRISTSIAPFVTVSPDRVFPRKKDAPVTLDVAVAIPSDAPASTVSGKIFLSKHVHGCCRSAEEALPVKLTVVRRYSANGVELEVPGGWTVDEESLVVGGPLSLNNFGNAYAQGGIRPEGGADIHVVAVPVPAIPLDEFIARELNGTDVEPATTITVAGEAATRVSYSVDFEGLFEEQTVAVYVPHGTEIYKFFLSYYSDDPSAAEYDRLFEALLATVSFTP